MLTNLRERSQRSFGVLILFGMLTFIFIFFFGPQSVGVGIGGPNAQVLINNNDDFSRFIILIWQLYAGFEILNKDFITNAFSFVQDDGTV